jgi:hypothetical protein
MGFAYKAFHLAALAAGTTTGYLTTLYFYFAQKK